MFNKFNKTIALTLAVALCCSTVKPVVAQSETASCKDIPSCGIAGIILTTTVIGKVLYYVVQDAAGHTKKVRAKQQVSQSNGESGNQDILIITTSPAKCYEIAKERGWVVKGLPKMLPHTGPLRTRELAQWACLIGPPNNE